MFFPFSTLIVALLMGGGVDQVPEGLGLAFAPLGT